MGGWTEEWSHWINLSLTYTYTCVCAQTHTLVDNPESPHTRAGVLLPIWYKHRLAGLHTAAFTGHGWMGVPSLSVQHRADMQAVASVANRSQRALWPRLPVGSAGSRMMGLGWRSCRLRKSLTVWSSLS